MSISIASAVAADTAKFTFHSVPSKMVHKPLYRVTHKALGKSVTLHASSANAAWGNFRNWNRVDARSAYTVELVNP